MEVFFSLYMSLTEVLRKVTKKKGNTTKLITANGEKRTIQSRFSDQKMHRQRRFEYGLTLNPFNKRKQNTSGKNKAP